MGKHTPIMEPIRTDPMTYSNTKLMTTRPCIPENWEVGEKLGKGANNTVYSVSVDGSEYALRTPRRRSDTQQRGSAIWEFRHTLKAAHLGVGPHVSRAFLAKHAKGKWPSGLYMVTERFQHDLDSALLDEPDLRAKAMTHRDALGNAIVECLQNLAKELIFVYDLKPSNIMVKLPDGDEDGEVKVRMIDFGRAFCEWAGETERDPESQTPIVDMLRKRIRARDPELSDKEVDELVSHVLFATMLVQIAATMTRVIRDDRGSLRIDVAARRELNVVSAKAKELLDGMQGRNIRLIRQVFRMDSVRTVMGHYHGRRDAGTRRTFRYARGVER